LTKKVAFLLIALMLVFVACNPSTGEAPQPASEGVTAEPGLDANQPTGMGMGPGSGMMARHHAKIPDEYAGLENPMLASEDSLGRGAELYSTYDDYLFWRISEGGTHEPFASAMPRWQDVLDDDARWDVINYVRALGSGQIMPGQRVGGAAFDAEAEAAKHDAMAAAGVQQGILTQEEADTFLAVHAEMDTLMAAGMEEQDGGMENMQTVMLARLVGDGRITQENADVFSNVHERLLAAGLME
jgi:hypothetical protein